MKRSTLSTQTACSRKYSFPPFPLLAHLKSAFSKVILRSHKSYIKECRQTSRLLPHSSAPSWIRADPEPLLMEALMHRCVYGLLPSYNGQHLCSPTSPGQRGPLMANLTISCPAPFLAESDYPSPGGYINGRFCGPVTADLSCCLPCPLAQWVYSDAFTYKANVAYWFNVPALVAQVFLMVTFVVLGRGKGNEGNGGHYLSWGLCGGLVMLEVSTSNRVLLGMGREALTYCDS